MMGASITEPHTGGRTPVMVDGKAYEFLPLRQRFPRRSGSGAGRTVGVAGAAVRLDGQTSHDGRTLASYRKMPARREQSTRAGVGRPSKHECAGKQLALGQLWGFGVATVLAGDDFVAPGETLACRLDVWQVDTERGSMSRSDLTVENIIPMRYRLARHCFLAEQLHRFCGFRFGHWFDFSPPGSLTPGQPRSMPAANF